MRCQLVLTFLLFGYNLIASIIEALGICVQEDSSEEMQKRIKASMKKMIAFFPDPSRAEDSFQKLNQMKDNYICDSLVLLLDELKIKDAETTRVSLLFAFLVSNQRYLPSPVLSFERGFCWL